MRLDILVRNSLLGVALAGLITTGAAQAQNKDATKDAAKAEKDATKDARKDVKVKKDKDRDPNRDNDKNKGEINGMHKAKGHSH